MRAVAIAIVVTLALTAVVPLVAAERQTVIFARWSSPDVCHVRNAQEVAFAEFARRPDDFRGKCIALRGHLGSRSLFNSLHDYYSLGGSPTRDDANRVRVGLYADDQTMRALWRAHRFDVKVIGLAATCGDLYGDNVVMVMGYCHYTGGPIVFMSDFTPVSVQSRRFLQSELPQGFANLGDVAGEAPLYAQVRAVAERWLDAVRRADTTAFLALHEGMRIEHRYDPDATLNRLLFSQRPRYGLITSGAHAPPFRVFQIPQQEDGEVEAYGCFCKSSDCDGLWPAHARDANTNAAWPYACFEVEIEAEGETRVSTWE